MDKIYQIKDSVVLHDSDLTYLNKWYQTVRITTFAFSNGQITEIDVFLVFNTS